MLLPDPPQLYGTLNRLEHYLVAERLGVIAASGDEYAGQAKTLLQLLLDDTEFETTIYATLFDRSFVDAKGWRARRLEVGTREKKKRITVTAEMTSSGHLSVRISPRRYAGYGKWGWAGEWRSDRSFACEQAGQGNRPADELLFFRDARELIKDFSDGIRLRTRNDDFDEIRRLHAQTIVLRFWKAALRLAFHFEVAVESYPTAAPNGRPRGPALEVINAVDAYRQQTEANFEAFERTIGHPPDRVWEICASRRSERGLFFRDEAARALNSVGGAHLRPMEIERAFSLLCTAAGFGIYVPPASLTEYAPLIKRPRLAATSPYRQITRRPITLPKASASSGLLSYTRMRLAPIEPTLAADLDVTSTADLVDKLNEIWKSRGERPLPQGSYPTNKDSLARVVRLYRNELKAGSGANPMSAAPEDINFYVRKK
ncbi:hypothetical protein [Bradyrhizobium sp. 23AC]